IFAGAVLVFAGEVEDTHGAPEARRVRPAAGSHEVLEADVGELHLLLARRRLLGRNGTVRRRLAGGGVEVRAALLHDAHAARAGQGHFIGVIALALLFPLRRSGRGLGGAAVVVARHAVHGDGDARQPLVLLQFVQLDNLVLDTHVLVADET